MEWALELVLAGLLLATFLQALRLERSLSAMKRDRGELEGLISGFKDSTRQAESGIQKLRALTDGAGRKMDAQIARSTELRQELAALMEQAERVAQRLEEHLPVSVLAREPLRAERRPSRAEENHAAEMELLAALRRRNHG
ncbi:MAG TPA: DUF6468 domain-containing protein [Rhodopila sp.]|uniref:DUF6468 domain-containing protein n=1 Tax=Rhodopila sp. TaxID=2480087 RepID=UPI002B60827B|nr:DUF6468 domain-containing protein [Rhodopila sp.]HVY17759.1 DUF6468 domain-containing protein [Rhodopila sp.]